MGKDKLSVQSMDFAVQIINLVKSLKEKRESIISNQIGRSGTSIGANIREANYARSKTDFSAKLQIALKECYETEFWIDLCDRTNLVPEEVLKKFKHDCGAIRRMLIKSINTVENNN